MSGGGRAAPAPPDVPWTAERVLSVSGQRVGAGDGGEVAVLSRGGHQIRGPGGTKPGTAGRPSVSEMTVRRIRSWPCVRTVNVAPRAGMPRKRISEGQVPVRVPVTAAVAEPKAPAVAVTWVIGWSRRRVTERAPLAGG
ncbi:hypothetical protein GCM10020001_101750 [Nonomuraea salmonea]